MKSAGAKGAVAKGAKRCADARNDPASYTTGGWQGFEFVTTLSGCLVSWEASGNADDLTTAIKYFNVLLDDYQNVGDGAGGDDVVTHDTGYAMRTFAPYAALAYDWLHDAPGVSVDLRTHARERFDAWVSYYASSGYLRDMPGSNYEAGFAFAATLISIAEGGEAGAAGDSHWATVRDQIWGKDLTPGFAAGGVLQGGDWPEGWQYGPLSVLEHALATRAMQDNGAPVAGASAWADSLVQRFANGLTPSTQQAYAAGDTEATTTNIVPDNGPLLAVIAGPASETARSWARKLDADLALSNDNPLFDALAAARAGANTAPANAPTSYTAAGTGNFYVRGAWTKDTAWSVFQCSRRLVDDHQHNDAGNFVLTRGADDLVVDPSPYGSLSTLTGNAPAVDSAVLPDGYSPSQAGWGQTTKLVWSKQSTSGIAVARCDYADQFRTEELPTDVPHALRDYVMVPSQGDGTVVLIDRVVTGAAGRSLHLRVRTPANLALDGDVATTTVGASALSIQRVYTSSGSGTVRDMPTTPECSSDNRGTCDTSRLPSGQEYRLDVAGPEAVAIHVMDAHAASAVAPTSTSLTGTGYRGVLVTRSTGSTAVIATDKADGSPVSTLTYSVPAGSGAVHVVVDAPAGDGGRSDVAGVVDGSNCKMTVTPHAGTSGGYDGHGLVVRVSSTCAVSDDGVVAPLVTSTSGTPTSTTTTGTPSGSSGTSTTASDGGSAAQSSSSGSTSAGMGVGGAATSDDGGGTPSFGAPSVGPSSAGSTNGINPTTPVTGGCAIRGGIPHDASAPIAAASCIGALVLGRRRKARRAARVRA
ncbi:MAG TPA: hypothetical protein VH062_25275 [Polyangiaceae bacterium]|nr:hypothetical protein [Polyangiaceae bacterium]